MPALVLTDHRLLTGAVEFVHACQKADIQPILGLEILLDTRKVSLLSTNTEGWSNLCRLSSAHTLQEDPNPPKTWGLLASRSKDLIALSDQQGESAAKRLKTLKDIFGNRLYLTLQAPSIASHTAWVSR